MDDIIRNFAVICGDIFIVAVIYVRRKSAQDNGCPADSSEQVAGDHCIFSLL